MRLLVRDENSIVFCVYKNDPNVVPEVDTIVFVLQVTFFSIDVPNIVFLSMFIIGTHLSVGSITHAPYAPVAGNGVAYNK